MDRWSTTQGAILGLVAMSEEGQNLNYAIASDVIKKFLFTGMQLSTRGTTSAGSRMPHPPKNCCSGELNRYDPRSRRLSIRMS